MIQLSSKTGLPKDTLGRGLTAAALKQLDRENRDSDQEDDVVTVASRWDMVSLPG
jgi:hypothetical protein